MGIYLRTVAMLSLLAACAQPETAGPAHVDARSEAEQRPSDAGPQTTDVGSQPSASASQPAGPSSPSAAAFPQPSDAGPRAAHAPTQDRTVLAAQVENARDLGGIPLADGARVRAAALFRGPPLANLTDEGCSAVAELGLRSVIDLRVDSEVSSLPDAPCVLDKAQLVAAPLPVPYNVSAADYIADLDAKESIAKVFQALGDAASYPVYFHCTWGRDRTGILAAVILLALGASPDVIMEDYLISRMTVGAYPASLEAALQEIAQRGGIDAYLAASGVQEHEIQALRAHAVE